MMINILIKILLRTGQHYTQRMYIGNGDYISIISIPTNLSDFLQIKNYLEYGIRMLSTF